MLTKLELLSTNLHFGKSDWSRCLFGIVAVLQSCCHKVKQFPFEINKVVWILNQEVSKLACKLAKMVSISASTVQKNSPKAELTDDISHLCAGLVICRKKNTFYCLQRLEFRLPWWNYNHFFSSSTLSGFKAVLYDNILVWQTHHLVMLIRFRHFTPSSAQTLKYEESQMLCENRIIK